MIFIPTTTINLAMIRWHFQMLHVASILSNYFFINYFSAVHHLLNWLNIYFCMTRLPAVLKFWTHFEIFCFRPSFSWPPFVSWEIQFEASTKKNPYQYTKDRFLFFSFFTANVGQGKASNIADFIYFTSKHWANSFKYLLQSNIKWGSYLINIVYIKAH